jgi:hypothetical protein
MAVENFSGSSTSTSKAFASGPLPGSFLIGGNKGWVLSINAKSAQGSILHNGVQFGSNLSPTDANLLGEMLLTGFSNVVV